MNENQLVSASADGSLKLWDILTSKGGRTGLCCRCPCTSVEKSATTESNMYHSNPSCAPLLLLAACMQATTSPWRSGRSTRRRPRASIGIWWPRTPSSPPPGTPPSRWVAKLCSNLDIYSPGTYPHQSSLGPPLQLWDPHHPRSLATFTGHQGCVYNAIWSPRHPKQYVALHSAKKKMEGGRCAGRTRLTSLSLSLSSSVIDRRVPTALSPARATDRCGCGTPPRPTPAGVTACRCSGRTKVGERRETRDESVKCMKCMRGWVG